MRIDAHQHFWVYDPQQYGWIGDHMQVLRRDFLPTDLKPLLGSTGFGGSVAVQARQTLEETRWLLELADQHEIIRGVVGWVDLRSPQVDEQLRQFSRNRKLRGVRHVVQDEPDDQFMLGEAFQRGLGRLNAHSLTYDLLLFPRHLPVAARLVERFPQQPFVLDHIAKPFIRDRQLEPWRQDLRALAKHANVCCKLSGMVTEARWRQWQKGDFSPYLEAALDAFGPQRVMIGSDWPVCTLSGDYAAVMEIVMEHISRYSAADQEAMLGGNCARFYGI